MFREKYGDDADAQLAVRTRQALKGIPKTLAAIQQITESIDAYEKVGSWTEPMVGCPDDSLRCRRGARLLAFDREFPEL